MISVEAPSGIPEIHPGDDLATLISSATALADGDVVVVTSKVVSKAEGRIRRSDTATELAGETRRVVARRGPTTIVRNRLGLTMAAAGIDASNVAPGFVVLLPEDPDASARALRERFARDPGVNVAVVVTDTAGRPWREGQTDIAIGAAGLAVLTSFSGQVDGYGNPLAVTAPAVADQIAGAAELAQGKLGARPVAVVRGCEGLVLAPGEHGAGAASLIRPEGSDLFGYGAREAVVRALAGRAGDQAPFGEPATAAEIVEALRVVGCASATETQGAVRATGIAREVASALAFAHGWTAVTDDAEGVLLSARPAPGR